MADTEIAVTDEQVVSVDEGASEDATQVEFSPVEQKALQEGWKPKEQWQGDPDEWRDARSYLDRGELLRKISQSNKEQKELRKAMQAMKEHNLKLAEAKAKEEMSLLRQEKIAALENNDAAKVVELDDLILEKKDHIAEITANARSQAIEDAQGSAPPEFAAWIDDNPWYANNAGMRGYADAIGIEYARSNPKLPPTEVLQYVAKKVKEEFNMNGTSKTSTNKPAAAVLDSNTRSGSASTRKGANAAIINSMSEQDRQIMNTLVKGGHISEEKYLEDFKKINRGAGA